MTEAEKARLRAELRRRKAAGGGNTSAPEKSTWQTIKENIVGDDDPTTQNLGEKVGTFLNKAGESMTFGLVGDEASAAVAGAIPGGQNYDERLAYERQQERLLEESNPGAMLGAEIGGGVLGAFLPGGQIGTLSRGVGMIPRVAASIGAGAGMGGTYGLMEGGEEGGPSRAEGARTGVTWGAGAGAVAPVLAGGVQKVADALVQRGPRRAALQAAKTAAEQRAGSRAAYSAFEGADAQISPDAMRRLAAQVATRIDDAGAPKIPGPLGKAPKSGRQINQTLGAMNDEVQAAAAQGQNPAVPLRAIEDVRKQAGKLGREVDNIGRPTHGAFIAQQAIEEIDQFVSALQTADVPVGDAKKAVEALEKARSMWKSAIKSQTLENISDRADTYLAGTASGLRNQIKTLLRQNQKTKMFSPDEVAALKKVIGNTALGRTVRLLGDGLGAKMATFGGGATGGVAGAAIGRGASELAANIGDTMTERNMEVAKALISSGALQNLPKAPDNVRRITEALARRIGAAVPQ